MQIRDFFRTSDFNFNNRRVLGKGRHSYEILLLYCFLCLFCFCFFVVFILFLLLVLLKMYSVLIVESKFLLCL